MSKKRIREWQFMDDDGKVKDGSVEIDDETWEALQSGMGEKRRQQLFDHYDRLAKWRFHHPQKGVNE